MTRVRRFWNGKLTEAALGRQLDEMQRKGIGEFFIHLRQGKARPTPSSSR